MESTWSVVTWSAAKWRWVTRPQVNRTVSVTNWYFVVLPLMLKEKSAFFSVGTLLWSGYDLRDLRPEWLLPSITANGQYYTSSCKSFFSLSDWWMDGLVEWVIDGLKKSETELTASVLYVAWKRWLRQKCARFVLFRLIKKRSFNLLCVLDWWIDRLICVAPYFIYFPTVHLTVHEPLAGDSGLLVWIRLQQPQMQGYPVLSYTGCFMFTVVSTL